MAYGIKNKGKKRYTNYGRINNIVRVTSNKKEADEETKRINKSFSQRKINRIAYVRPLPKGYVKQLTRKGYPIKNKNYGVAISDK